MVYFITDGTYTKIGKADYPEKRLKELQTGSPKKLTISLQINGDEKEEIKLHRIFNRKRIFGEWFIIDFKYDEELIYELLDFELDTRGLKFKYKRKKEIKDSKKLIMEAVYNLINLEDKVFITYNTITEICNISLATVKRNSNLFKNLIDNYNILNFNACEYNNFLKKESINKIVFEIKNANYKISQRKIAYKSNLHINTVCNLWNEKDIQNELIKPLL